MRKYSDEEYKKLFPNLKPFAPGVSGNAAGRPKLDVSITSITKEILKEPAPDAVVEPLRRRGMIPKAWLESNRVITWRDVKGLRNVIAAVSPKGDTMSLEIWRRMDGRVPLEISGPGGGPIEVRKYDFSKLTTDELHLLAKLCEKVEGESDGSNSGDDVQERGQETTEKSRGKKQRGKRS